MHFHSYLLVSASVQQVNRPRRLGRRRHHPGDVGGQGRAIRVRRSTRSLVGVICLLRP